MGTFVCAFQGVARVRELVLAVTVWTTTRGLVGSWKMLLLSLSGRVLIGSCPLNQGNIQIVVNIEQSWRSAPR